MSHTPGEWRVRNDYYVEDMNGQALFKSLDCDTLSISQQAANARLIAAAPDLLEYLKRTLTFLETIKPQHVPLYQNSESLYNEIDALLGKARGEE